jgi:hypothetical protein
MSIVTSPSTGEMIDRKQAYFAKNRRFIISFDLKNTGGRNYHIIVVSTAPSPPDR